jgi:hypothetical protein
MRAFGGPAGYVRRLRLVAVAGVALVLAALAACLNPQPDDNPLARPSDSQAPASNPTAVGVAAPDMDPPLFKADLEESPPTSPVATQAPAPRGGTSSSDAGAPLDAGRGDAVEGDAGSAD